MLKIGFWFSSCKGLNMEDTYTELARYLDTLPAGYPPSERVLKYTPGAPFHA